MKAKTQLKDSAGIEFSTAADDFCRILGIDFSSTEAFVRSLPFSMNDSTAGIENELQTVVEGDGQSVDLPVVIRESNFYKNTLRRARSGDGDKSLPENLKNFIDKNPSNVWENSWVRFDRERLSSYANHIFNHDLLADKKKPEEGRRTDADHFFTRETDENGETRLKVRIPVSYLLKMSLADLIGRDKGNCGVIKVTGEALMHHYLNDNTSPEMFSFHTVSHDKDRSIGEKVASEAMKRYLLTQLLAMHANSAFGLKDSGQKVVAYYSAHPPIRQKQLNELIPDGFYRELFMSPCLSGWDRGEDKKTYMGLCHRVLSRSQLNAVSKLKDAGIITRNLVVLPNMSNISLANNGTHVSLGSRKLSALLEDKNSGFTARHEKYIGDLVIKTMEHFLPLFVNTYSAAPYRMDFADFHPEKILAFLPHELDYTHLRMIWRRWKKKARLKIFGKSVTPMGPHILDRFISRMFGLKGDLVPDFRLIDYFACLMGTEESPSLDGTIENGIRLKKDLTDMGVFDTRMPLYLIYRMRHHADMGFSGFEGRYYSMFDSFGSDLAHSVNLQMLITAFCFQSILTGAVTHGTIPDDPFTESERRQVFFAAAIGVPTFYIRKDSGNTFILKILESVERTRNSRRYPGYVRVHVGEYLKGLVRFLKSDARDLIRVLGLEDTMEDLEKRIQHPHVHSVSAKLVNGVMKRISKTSRYSDARPLNVPAAQFNGAAESYYRCDLRKKQMGEALSHLRDEFEKMELWVNFRETSYREILHSILCGESPVEFIGRIEHALMDDEAPPEDVTKLASLLILCIHFDKKKNEAAKGKKTQLSVAVTEG